MARYRMGFVEFRTCTRLGQARLSSMYSVSEYIMQNRSLSLYVRQVKDRYQIDLKNRTFG